MLMPTTICPKLLTEFCNVADISVQNFYRTQVSLGSGLWVPASLTPYETLVETLLM